MCGLAGVLGYPGLPDQVLLQLGKALDHRGPDGQGVWRDPATDQACLLHRRLAIQDLTPAGLQPMQSACGRYVLVFNGEIYNQHELRQELEGLGHHFHSRSDTEVLLELLGRFGLAAFHKLRGMYAFCVWDRQEQKALLARDPFGIKPLYLWQGETGQLLFASEVRALLATGLIPKRLDVEALADFLGAGSLVEPRTLVAGISSLPPGAIGTWHRGHWQIQPHFQPSYGPNFPLEMQEAALATRQALAASVKAHLLSDVPVGLFLSGGLDSSALLALAAHADLTTLSIGFCEPGFDESPRAAAVASHFGSKHVALQLDAYQAAEMLPQFLAAVDQPSVDGFNTFCVAKLAADQGLKVVLSGLGGDELFGGYPSFATIPKLLQWHQRLGLLRPLLAYALSQSSQHKRQRLAAFLSGPGTVFAAHRCLRGLFAPAEVELLMRHWGLKSFATSEQEERSTPSELADAIAWIETSSYMGQQLLRDSDCFSMAHGLELRLPFVDAAFFRSVADIPSNIRTMPDKQLLRRALPELVAAMAPAPKQGFSFPFQQWFDASSSPLRPGSHAFPLPPIPASLDLSSWARRWGLMVMHHWLRDHLDLELV